MSRRHSAKLLPTLAIALAALVLADGVAQAQSRRARRSRAQSGQSAVTNSNTTDPFQAAYQEAVIQNANPRMNAGRGNSFGPSLTPPAPTGRTSQAQIQRDWGNYVRNNPRQMRFINQQTGGFPVRGGMYVPGYGVINGAMFGGPNTEGLIVNGGLYLPGYGVVNGQNIDGPSAVGSTVNGGTYLPGFGVVGGSLRNGSTASGTNDGLNFSGPAVGNLAGGPVVPGFNANLGTNSYSGPSLTQFGSAPAVDPLRYYGGGSVPLNNGGGLPSFGGPAVGTFSGPYLPSYAPAATSFGGPATPGFGGPAVIGNQTGPAVPTYKP